MADEAKLKEAREILGRAASDVEACRNRLLDAQVVGESKAIDAMQTALDAAFAWLCTAADAYKAAGGQLGQSREEG